MATHSPIARNIPPALSCHGARGTGDGKRASVEVRFASGWSSYSLIYRLVHEANGWKLDDIVYSNDDTFLTLLTMP
jgi:hypothetical protein